MKSIGNGRIRRIGVRRQYFYSVLCAISHVLCKTFARHRLPKVVVITYEERIDRQHIVEIFTHKFGC